MPRAKVKWFNDSKGYGYATMDDERDVFCHYSQIEGVGFKTLSPAESITFDLYEDSGRLSAKCIRRENE